MEKANLALIGILLITVYYTQAQSTTTATAKPTTAPPPLSACKLPADPGLCRAAMRKYHFDVETGKCNRFTYGGCGGNSNRFDTMEECEAFGKRCQQQGSG